MRKNCVMFIVAILAMLVTFSTVALAYDDNQLIANVVQYKIVIDGEEQSFLSPIVNINGTTYVPAADFCENLGFYLNQNRRYSPVVIHSKWEGDRFYDPESLIIEGNQAIADIVHNTVVIDEEMKNFEFPTVKLLLNINRNGGVRDVTYVPLRELCRELGMEVRWDPGEQLIYADNKNDEEIKHGAFHEEDNEESLFRAAYGDILCNHFYMLDLKQSGLLVVTYGIKDKYTGDNNEIYIPGFMFDPYISGYDPPLVMAKHERVDVRMEKQLWPQELERIKGLMNSAYYAEIPSYTAGATGYAGGPWDIMIEIGDKVFCYDDRGVYYPYYQDNNGKWKHNYNEEPVDERLTELWKELAGLSPLKIEPYHSRSIKDK